MKLVQRLLLQKLNYRSYQCSTLKINEEQIKVMQQQYKKTQQLSVFSQLFAEQTESINYMKVFRILSKYPYNYKNYTELLEIVDKNILKKSDTVLLMQAMIYNIIANQFYQNKLYNQSQQLLYKGMDILENCLIPPVLPYYRMYRQCGFINYQNQQHQKSKEVLIEAVRIIEQFLQHSDDYVASDENCIMQAKACNILAQIDSENPHWLSKANQYWSQLENDKFQFPQYAKTVVLNYQKYALNDLQKAKVYLQQQINQTQNQQVLQILQLIVQKNKL